DAPWPAFTDVSGEVVFDRDTMEIRNASARVFGVTLSGVSGGIRDLSDRSVLALEGSARGPLADMLRFVHDSPVGEWLGGGLEEATATGAAELKLALALPLYDMDAATVKGRLALAGNDVRLGSGIPLLGGAAARIDFTQERFAIADGTARVLGGEARFE